MSENIIPFPNPEEYRAQKESKKNSGVIDEVLPEAYWSKYIVRQDESGYVLTIIEDKGLGRYISGLKKSELEKYEKDLEESGFSQTDWHD